MSDNIIYTKEKFELLSKIMVSSLGLYSLHKFFWQILELFKAPEIEEEMCNKLARMNWFETIYEGSSRSIQMNTWWEALILTCFEKNNSNVKDAAWKSIHSQVEYWGRIHDEETRYPKLPISFLNIFKDRLKNGNEDEKIKILRLSLQENLRFIDPDNVLRNKNISSEDAQVYSLGFGLEDLLTKDVGDKFNISSEELIDLLSQPNNKVKKAGIFVALKKIQENYDLYCKESANIYSTSKPKEHVPEHNLSLKTLHSLNEIQLGEESRTFIEPFVIPLLYEIEDARKVLFSLSDSKLRSIAVEEYLGGHFKTEIEPEILASLISDKDPVIKELAAKAVSSMQKK